MAEAMFCPFLCGYKAENDYGIMLHLETQHPEPGTTSPFVAHDGNAGRGQDKGMKGERRVRGQNESPKNGISSTLESGLDNDDFVYCPVEGCGEALMLTELEAHVDMHGEEDGVESSPDRDDNSSSRADYSYNEWAESNGSKAGFDTKLSYALRNLEDVDVQVHEKNDRNGRKEASKSEWGQILKMPEKKRTRRRSRSRERGRLSESATDGKPGKRLGKAELGPYANEKQMPSWLVTLLESDGKLETTNQIEKDGTVKRIKTCPNMSEGIVTVITNLLGQDPNVAYGYLCSPAVRHVSKLKREGGFCGYRNIQMLCSYMIEAKSPGSDILGPQIPTIFQIQDWVENAWDNGINAQGRIETGGIKGTRKYIGTPEAQAMFVSLGISCDAQAFKTRKESSPKLAYELLFAFVESYFVGGCSDFDSRVRPTTLPPIYFQHPGHSMTIIGFQKSSDGSRELLVFDPMFHDSPQILKLVGDKRARPKRPGELLKAYRRGSKYLRKYGEFEILSLSLPAVMPSS